MNRVINEVDRRLYIAYSVCEPNAYRSFYSILQYFFVQAIEKEIAIITIHLFVNLYRRI